MAALDLEQTCLQQSSLRSGEVLLFLCADIPRRLCVAVPSSNVLCELFDAIISALDQGGRLLNLCL